MIMYSGTIKFRNKTELSFTCSGYSHNNGVFVLFDYENNTKTKIRIYPLADIEEINIQNYQEL
jgi:hypothetical protein